MKLLRLLAVALCVASPALAQVNPGTSPLSIAKGGTSAATAAAARTALGLLIGTNVQAWDADLDAVAALACTGAIVRTASNTVTCRTITGTAAEITVTNGDGVSGVPTLSLPTALTFTGKTVTGGTFASPALTTPTLGVATATLINKYTLTAPASAATLTILNNKTATFNNSITFAGTDATTMTFPTTTATIARTDAANTFTGHQTIEGVTSTGATGAGALVFGTSPAITTPTGIVRADVGLPIGQIPGIATNTVASAGNVGEVLSSTVLAGSAVSLTSGAISDVTSKSLTSGHWEVSGTVCFNGGTSTSFTLLEGWINSISVTQPTSPAGGAIEVRRSTAFILSSGQDSTCFPTGPVDVYLSSPTTYYLSVTTNFTVSTATAYGILRAIRVQ